MTTSDSLSPANPPVAPRKQFRLSGPSPRIDPTRVAVRRDLADIALADRVFAQHYAEPMTVCVRAATAVRAAPAADAEPVASLAEGAGFAMLERGDIWCWGRCCDGGCVGYVESAALELP